MEEYINVTRLTERNSQPRPRDKRGHDGNCNSMVPNALRSSPAMSNESSLLPIASVAGRADTR